MLMIRVVIGNKSPALSVNQNGKYFFGVGGTPDGQISVADYVSFPSLLNPHTSLTSS